MFPATTRLRLLLIAVPTLLMGWVSQVALGQQSRLDFVARHVQGTSVQRDTQSPLQAADLLSVNFPWEVAISPDGTQVAYSTISPPDEKGKVRTQFWVQRFDGENPTLIGPREADNKKGVWSPNGTKLAFYTGPGERSTLAILDVRTGTVHATSVAVGFNAPAAQWTPDGTQLLAARTATGPPCPAAQQVGVPDPAATSAITVLTTENAQQNRLADNVVVRSSSFDPEACVDLVLVDGTTGVARIVMPHVTPTRYQLSPDGTKFFYTLKTGSINSDVNSRTIFDIIVVDLQNQQITTAAHDILTSLSSDSVTWSHGSSMLAFIGGGNLADDSALHVDSDSQFLRGNCFIIDLRYPEKLRSIGPRQFSRFMIPVWNRDDSAVYAITLSNPVAGSKIVKMSLETGETSEVFRSEYGFNSYGFMGDVTEANCLYVSVRAKSGEAEVLLLDLTKGTSTRVFHAFQEMGCWGCGMSLSHDGKRAAYTAIDIAHPGDVWVADNRFAATRQLTHLNPNIEHRSLGVGESVTWQAQGTTFNGTLLLPANYSSRTRYPTLLYVYPGLKAGTDLRNEFVLTPYTSPQLFASHGYAVFIPDSILHVGSPMRDIADVILPGVDKVIAMGIADPDRLGVYGVSYGGYATLSLIVQTNRFKAAVSEAGFSNLITQYAQLHSDGSDSMGWAENDQGRMGGTPWQYRDRYIENSPFFYLDRVQTPILLEYGGADERVDPSGSREAFVALRRLGKTATLVGYAGEGHGLSKPSYQIDFSTRMLDWFDKYLAPKSKN